MYDTSLHCYKEISEMAEGHGGESLPKSQAIKDATMVYFINTNMKENTKFLTIMALSTQNIMSL